MTKRIEVELDGSEWSVDRGDRSLVIITVTGVTVPIPASVGSSLMVYLLKAIGSQPGLHYDRQF